MFSERPSQRKVVGVARRYLHYQETTERATRNIERFKSEEMDLGEVYRVSYSLGFTAVSHLLAMPIHLGRRSFLRHAQTVEGHAPGEERLEMYALRVANTSQDSYPLVREALRG